MGRGNLTEDEVRILKASPYVISVNKNRIVYTDEFKHHFVQEYLAGKGPTTIFREAGIPKEILGSKRIERCAIRWKEAYYAGSLGMHRDVTQYHADILENPTLSEEEKEEINMKQIKRRLWDKKRQVRVLEGEIEELQEQLRLIGK